MTNTNKKITLCIRGLETGEEILWVTPEQSLNWMQEQQNEEFIITDYEAPFYISEYDNIDKIIEKAEQLENFSDDEIETLEFVLEHHTNDFDEAVEIVQNGDYRVYEDCWSMSDVAAIIADECGILENVPEICQKYFDYESYGRDLEKEGCFYYDGMCKYIEIFR